MADQHLSISEWKSLNVLSCMNIGWSGSIYRGSLGLDWVGV